MTKMWSRYCIVYLLVLVCIGAAYGKRDSRLLARAKVLHSRIASKVIQQRCRASGWDVSDFFWIINSVEDNFDDLIDFNTSKYCQMHPDYMDFKYAFNGYLFKQWDGWSKVIIEYDGYQSYFTHNSKGLIVECYEEEYIHTTQAYNNNNQLTEWVIQYWDEISEVWEYDIKMTIAYNTRSSVQEMLLYFWYNDWELSDKIVFNYDGNNNCTEEVGYVWNEVSNEWEIGESKYTYAYDANKNIIEDISFYWDEVSEDWVCDGYKYTYAYDGSNRLIEDICWYYNGNDEWEREDRYTYGYDTQGNVTEIAYFEVWDDISSSWEPYDKMTFSYNAAGDYSQIIIADWGAGSKDWVEWDKTVLSYTANNNLDELINYEKNETTDEWDFYFKDIFSYDAKGRPETMIEYEYDLTTEEWVLYDQIDFTFEDNIGIKQKITKGMKNGINCIIQTGKDNLTVTVSGKPSGKDMLTVYDLQGRVITQLKPEGFQGNTVYTLHYNNSNCDILAKKVFILAIQKGKTLFTHRFIPL